MGQLSQIRLFECRNNSAHLGMRTQRFYSLKNLFDYLFTDVRHILLRIPLLDFFKVRNR